MLIKSFRVTLSQPLYPSWPTRGVDARNMVGYSRIERIVAVCGCRRLGWRTFVERYTAAELAVLALADMRMRPSWAGSSGPLLRRCCCGKVIKRENRHDRKKSP